MAGAIASHAADGTANGNTATASFTSSSGDLLVCVVGHTDASGDDLPTGFTQIGQIITSGSHYQTWGYKVSTGDSSASVDTGGAQDSGFIDVWVTTGLSSNPADMTLNQSDGTNPTSISAGAGSVGFACGSLGGQVPPTNPSETSGDWTQDSDHDFSDTNRTSGRTYREVFASAGTADPTWAASDSWHARSVLVIEADSGTPLAANAGPDDSVEIDTNVALAGSATGGATPYTYAWSVVSSPGGSTVTFSDSTSATSNVQADIPGSYTLRLTVTDNDSTVDTDDMVLTVTAPALVASAGPDANTQINVPYQLAGGSTGGYGAVSYAWTVISDPASSTETFSPSANVEDPTVEVDTVGAYTLRITATDSDPTGPNVDTDDVVITGQLDAPLVNAGADFGLGTGANGNMDGSVTSNEPSTTTTWSKVSGPGVVTFGDANSLTSSVSIDTAGTHVLRLAADDGTNPAVTDDVTVTVTDPAPPPDEEFPVQLLFRDGVLRLRTTAILR